MQLEAELPTIAAAHGLSYQVERLEDAVVTLVRLQKQ